MSNNILPFFCDKCKEIRNSDEFTLLHGYEELQYKSFGYCSKCREYINTHTKEEVENNKKNYQISLSSEKVKTLNDIYITLYYIDKCNDKYNTINNFINKLIFPNKFSEFSLEKQHPITKEFISTRKLLTPITEIKAIDIIKILSKYEIDYFYEKVQI